MVHQVQLHREHVFPATRREQQLGEKTVQNCRTIGDESLMDVDDVSSLSTLSSAEGDEDVLVGSRATLLRRLAPNEERRSIIVVETLQKPLGKFHLLLLRSNVIFFNLFERRYCFPMNG